MIESWKSFHLPSAPDIDIIQMSDTETETQFSMGYDRAGLDSYYDKRDGIYVIDQVFVHADRRRQGLARYMVQTAIEHAQTLQARRIEAEIATPDGLALMSDIFGWDTIRASHDRDHDALRLRLDYELQAQAS